MSDALIFDHDSILEQDQLNIEWVEAWLVDCGLK